MTLATSFKRQALLKMLSHIKYGELKLKLPDGCTHKFTGSQKGPTADMVLLSDSAIIRILDHGKMGFCEAFMVGEIDSDNLTNLIELAVLHDSYLEEQIKLGTLQKLWLKLQHWRNRNNQSGSKRNISYHYDLGNQFYSRWLDRTMTYSSAVFQSETDTLEDAQNRKYQKLAELADIQPGERVLEIGCGWGGFAEYAAKEYGAHVTGITISKEQYDFTKNRLRTAGLDHMTDIVMQDYRKLNQRFDKIVSIEMFEAVGEKYWPVYFKTIANCLKDGGKAALQVITIDHKAFLEYRTQPDFIQKYIFPGGMLPSIKALDVPLKTAGLSLHFCQGYGQDYARTLAEWKVRFHQAWPELAAITKFDDRFKRMWELYLSYCEGGFKAGMIDVKQMLITHK
ncbi:MAG: class I SAM-dependent methyltransferase [Candidatus Puniceispirillaceae bacterium]